MQDNSYKEILRLSGDMFVRDYADNLDHGLLDSFENMFWDAKIPLTFYISLDRGT